jgi:hypothetical protein
MNAGEECVGCDPILPRMIFMRGWTDVFMMPWWGRRREGMPNGQKIGVREVVSIGLGNSATYRVSDHGRLFSC